MATTKKIPAIRFKGFEGEWKEEKLNSLCSIVTKQTGFDYSATIKPSLIRYYSSDNYSFIQNKDFSGNDINLKTDFYIPKKIAELYPNILLDKPSILISISGKIGNVGFYQLSKKAFIGGAVGICKLITASDGLIILYNLLSDKGQKFFQSLIKASSHSNITVEDIRKIPIYLPISKLEKPKIGNYFKELDNLIQLQEQKLKKVINLKNAMLEKMFPAANADVPEIRFKGFTDNWQRKKLGELADFNPKSELPSQFEYVDLESVIGTKMIFHRTEMKKTAPSRAQRLAKKGDLFYQTVRPYQKNNFLFELPFKDYVFSTGYTQLRPKVDGRLLLNIVQKKSFVEDVLAKCTGTSYPVISSTDLALIEIQIPTNEDEQKKIGNYFQNLDQLISQSQQKIKQLKHLKQALLQKMFI